MGITKNMKNYLFLCKTAKVKYAQQAGSGGSITPMSEPVKIQGFLTHLYFRKTNGEMWRIDNTDTGRVYLGLNGWTRYLQSSYEQQYPLTGNPYEYGTYEWNGTTYNQWEGYVGTGTAAETLDDYNIQKITDVNHSFNINVSQDEDLNTVSRFTISGTNASDTAITISEIGIFRIFCNYTNSRRDEYLTSAYYNTYQNPGIGLSTTPVEILMLRKVLDTPITVEPGASYMVTMDYVEGVGA